MEGNEGKEKVRKTIYLYNKDVVAHVNSKPNMSAYIEDLVFKDMTLEQRQSLTREEVIDLIKEYCKDPIKEGEKECGVNKETKNSIMNLLSGLE